MNETIVEVIVGLLLALSAGVRVTVPLLALAVLAHQHVIVLPHNFAWLGAETSLVLLGVACGAETCLHFVPAVGTYLKALATPMAFIGGTLLMAIPLSHQNPMYQWTLAAVVGGGTATLTNLGVTGARLATAPANVASFGVFGLLWNLGEMVVSFLLVLLGGICGVVGFVGAAFILLSLVTFLAFAIVRGIGHLARRRRAPSAVPASALAV